MFRCFYSNLNPKKVKQNRLNIGFKLYPFVRCMSWTVSGRSAVFVCALARLRTSNEVQSTDGEELGCEPAQGADSRPGRQSGRSQETDKSQDDSQADSQEVDRGESGRTWTGARQNAGSQAKCRQTEVRQTDRYILVAK